MKGYFYVVPEHGDNIGGLSATILYCLYKAVRENKQVTFVHKTIFWGRLLKRRRLMNFVHRHPLFDLESPHIRREPRWGVYKAISWFFGLIFLFKWVRDYALHKLGLLGEDFGKMPRVGFGVSDIYNVERLPSFSAASLRRIDWKKELDNPPEVSLPASWEISSPGGGLDRMGLRPRSYVALHIRTPYYKGIGNVSEDNATRNADPKRYDPAIDSLISKGYTVVRLGDPVPGLVAPRKGFFDYANSRFKSEEMDLALIKSCFFYFGTNSGIFDTAVLLGPPILLVNSTDFLQARPTKSSDIVIFKRVLLKPEARPMPFHECFEMPYLHNISERYAWLENSSEDIGAAALEMIGQLEGSLPPLTEKQRLFRESLQGLVDRTLADSPDFQHNRGDKYRNYVEDTYRHAIQSHFNGRVGREFAEKYY